MGTDCIFCRIVAREIPASLIAEDEWCVAFRDINAQAPTHILVVPREHVDSLNEVTDPTLVARLFTLATRIAGSEGFSSSGYRAVINTNDDGGQTVHHLHLHVLAGRRMKWPPG